MRAATLALAAALVASALVPAADGGDETVDLDSAPGSSWLRTDYYGLYRGEARVGWLSRGLLREERNGAPVVVRVVHTEVEVATGMTQVSDDRITYAADGAQQLIFLAHESSAGDRTFSRTVTRNETRFDVTTKRGDEETSGSVNAFRVTLADELGLERLIASSLSREDGPVGARMTSAGLDVRTMQRTARTLAVIEVDESGEDGREFVVAVEVGPGEWSQPLRADATGSILTGAFSAGLTLRRLSEDDALRPIERTTIASAQRIQAEGSIERPEATRLLKVSFPAPAEGAPAPFAESARQKIERGAERWVLTVDASADAGEADEAAREAALEPEGLIDSDHERLASAVNRVLVGAAQPPVRVDRLLRFTAGHLVDEVVIDEKSASQLLVSRHGDCTEHARLFVALCRAAGMPAREVHGLVWTSEGDAGFAWHAWAEVVLLGRWRPVDPVRGAMPADATHLRVAADVDEASLVDSLTLKIEPIKSTDARSPGDDSE